MTRWTSHILLPVVLLKLARSPPITTAFVKSIAQYHTISLQISTQSLLQNTFEDILEDQHGRINPVLAQRIWKWERQQRLNLDIPDVQNYSTRDGLRWVNELVKARAKDRESRSRLPPNYDDLIQEGVIGLMQALRTFEHQAEPNESFESFAKKVIERSLQSYMVDRAKGTGAGPSYMDGSKKQRQPPPLSMESTVKITDPIETESHYFNQEEWEFREGLVLDNGKSVQREEVVEEFLDDSMQYEGEDQMWIHEQSVVAPLRDSIPETDTDDVLVNPSSPDEMALMDMILYNVDDFLGKALNEIETQVIRMRFGLDDGIPKTQKDVAFDLDLTVTQVRKHQKRGLEKLREAFSEQYVSDQASHDNHWEDTA